MLFVLLAFAGCQRGPALYQPTENPREVAVNAEKFVKQVTKRAKNYTTEDWQNAVQQFVAMSKNYVESSRSLTEDEKMRFDNARLQFMAAVDATGNEALAAQVKEAYGSVMQ